MSRVKGVQVVFRQVRSEISEYTCPHCHTTIVGAGLSRDTLRFTCSHCRKELNVVGHILRVLPTDSAEVPKL